jgi:hypothetical protein
MFPEASSPQAWIIAQAPAPAPVDETRDRQEVRDNLDIIILTVYLICVIYVLFQAWVSLDDQTKVSLVRTVVTTADRPDEERNGEAKDEKDRQDEEIKLEDSDLKDEINIKFKFDKRYVFNLDNAEKDKQPRELNLTIENKSKTTAIFVDWESCALTDQEGRSRRVIRLTPDKRLEDLAQWQARSVVAPGRNLKEKITAEDVLKLNEEKNLLEPGKPLIDINGLKKASENKKTPKFVKEMYANFINYKKPLKFSLYLSIQFSQIKTGIREDKWHILRCDFEVENRPWTDYLPYQKK